MHIEEPDSPATLRAVGDTGGRVHLADNTRKEPGSGDIDFKAIFAALKEVGCGGYRAYECGLSGPAGEVFPRSAAFRRCLSPIRIPAEPVSDAFARIGGGTNPCP